MLITFVLFIIHSQKRDLIWKRSVRGLTLLYVDVLWNSPYFNFFFLFFIYIYIFFFLLFMFLFMVVLSSSLVLSLSNFYSSLFFSFSSSLSIFMFPSDLGNNPIVLCRKLTAFSFSFLSLLFISDFLKTFTNFTNDSQYIIYWNENKIKITKITNHQLDMSFRV